MPLREIEAQFTRSEMHMLAWRSQEQYWQMKDKFKETEKTSGQLDIPMPHKGSKNRKEYDGKVPTNLPDHFYNEQGEIDLRQVTGDEAYRFFQMQGIRLPIYRRS